MVLKITDNVSVIKIPRNLLSIFQKLKLDEIILFTFVVWIFAVLTLMAMKIRVKCCWSTSTFCYLISLPSQVSFFNNCFKCQFLSKEKFSKEKLDKRCRRQEKRKLVKCNFVKENPGRKTCRFEPAQLMPASPMSTSWETCKFLEPFCHHRWIMKGASQLANHDWKTRV